MINSAYAPEVPDTSRERERKKKEKRKEKKRKEKKRKEKRKEKKGRGKKAGKKDRKAKKEKILEFSNFAAKLGISNDQKRSDTQPATTRKLKKR